MFQEITVIGNVGQDPTNSISTTGKSVAVFNTAVNEKYGSTETTTWFKIEAWNDLAEKLVAPHVKKGRQVFVQGRIKVETWTDKNGAAHSQLVIIASTIRLLGAKPE